jgi:hypothetical protein
VPAIVVGQAWRDGRRQVPLARALAGCRVDPVGLDVGKAAGILCGKTGTSDVVDAAIVVMATALRGTIWTSDTKDIRALTAQAGAKPAAVVRGV